MVYGKRFKKEPLQMASRGSRPGRRRPRLDVLQPYTKTPFLDHHGAYLFQLLLQLATLEDLESTKASQLVRLIMQEIDELSQDLEPKQDQNVLELFAQLRSDLTPQTHPKK